MASVRRRTGAHGAAIDEAERLAGGWAVGGLRLLKLCFLELLQPEARGAVFDDLKAAHRRALDEAQAALAGCRCRCGLVQRWLARDVERWKAELCWLEGLAREYAPAPHAPL